MCVDLSLRILRSLREIYKDFNKRKQGCVDSYSPIPDGGDDKNHFADYPFHKPFRGISVSMNTLSGCETTERVAVASSGGE